MSLDDTRLLAFAAKLQSATNVEDLLKAAIAEVRETIGYQTAWIAIFNTEDRTVRMLAVESPDVDIWTHAAVFPLDNDPYMARILTATSPQVVVDAQTDPGVNREIVEVLGNRTIINVPMRLLDQPFGSLGTGSFGDEGVKVPSEEQLAYLDAMAKQLVVASARIVVMRQRQEAAAEGERIRKLLEQRQRLASVGQLAGGVAHDFNNLLTVIMASASFLQRREDTEKGRDELQLILDASERAADLTRRLLTIGRRQPLRLAELAPATMMTALHEMMRRVIPANITVELDCSASLPHLLADQAQLEQVVTNLCLNARDAMADGGTLSLTCREVGHEDEASPASRASRRCIEIAVRDSGIGIPAHVQERIFEPFFTTKGPNEGTGLGLAVCRGIVDQHGGTIGVDSEEGVGTTFRVLLPVREVPATTTPLPTRAKPTEGSERVLVADDQPHVRRAITRMLEMSGYEVTSVGDGEAAIEAARAEPFDLVILDAIMPKMGGRRAYDAILALRPDTRFLFASGYGAEEVTARFLADTNVPLLQKPFSVDALLEIVRKVLDTPG